MAFSAGKRFSAYNPQTAAAKQKCLAHLERDLEALKNSRFTGNRELQERVGEILWAARTAPERLSHREIEH